MRTRYLVAQLQTQILLLAATGLKEYEADWLKNTDKVVRDATGRFASKAASVAQQTKGKTEDGLKEAQSKVTDFKQAVQELAKEPKKAKLRVSSELLKITGKGLGKIIEKNPKFANRLTSLMFGVDAQKARRRLSRMYYDIDSELAKEIEKDPFQEIANNARSGKLRKEDLIAVFEYAGNKYNKMIDDLDHLEGQPDYIRALAKTAATSIPVTAFLATTLAPEVAIGLLLGDGLEAILVSAAASQAASAGASKAMDAMNVNDPLVRMGVDIAINLGVSASISKGYHVLGPKIEKEKLIRKAFAEEAKEYVAKQKAGFDKIAKQIDLKLNFVPEKIAKHIDEKNLKIEAEMAAKYGKTKVEAAIANMQKIVDDGDIYIRVPDLKIVNLIHEGRFKSTLETDAKGTFAYKPMRQAVEKKAFGISSKDTSKSYRPIYGYLAHNNRTAINAEGIRTNNYGKIAVKLKERVKQRSTFTCDDTFQNPHASTMDNAGFMSVMGGVAKDAGTILEKLTNAKNLDDLRKVNPGGGNPRYVEAQIFGRLHPEDIEEVIIKDMSQEAIDLFGDLVEGLTPLKKAGVRILGNSVDPEAGLIKDTYFALVSAGGKTLLKGFSRDEIINRFHKSLGSILLDNHNIDRATGHEIVLRLRKQSKEIADAIADVEKNLGIRL